MVYEDYLVFAILLAINYIFGWLFSETKFRAPSADNRFYVFAGTFFGLVGLVFYFIAIVVCMIVYEIYNAVSDRIFYILGKNK